LVKDKIIVGHAVFNDLAVSRLSLDLHRYVYLLSLGRYKSDGKVEVPSP
jgi:hypothetical protein